MKHVILLAAAALGLAALTGCEKQIKAPEDRGVCFMLADKKGGGIRFNKIASNVPDIEHCALELEIIRLRFLRLGSQQTEVAGAYQGNFLFLQKEGIYTSKKLTGVRYLALVRYRGELVMPGAIVEGSPAPVPAK